MTLIQTFKEIEAREFFAKYWLWGQPCTTQDPAFKNKQTNKQTQNMHHWLFPRIASFSRHLNVYFLRWDGSWRLASMLLCQPLILLISLLHLLYPNVHERLFKKIPVHKMELSGLLEGAAFQDSPALSLPFPSLYNMAWLLQLETHSFSCLLSAWGEVGREAETARHGIDGVWKPRARVVGSPEFPQWNPT